MFLLGDMEAATFLRRLNRFSVLVEKGKRQETAFLPNSGRLAEVLVPGTQVLLKAQENPHRQTRYDLVLARLGQVLVSVDARIPNELLYRAFLGQSLLPFKSYKEICREVRFGESRLDFFLAGSDKGCFVEAKSVTLVRDNRGLFPDAPTSRGRRHLQSLAAAVEKGMRAAAVFVIQREDVAGFSPNSATDPLFAGLLREVKEQGVEVYAYKCRVNLNGIELSARVPVYL